MNVIEDILSPFVATLTVCNSVVVFILADDVEFVAIAVTASFVVFMLVVVVVVDSDEFASVFVVVYVDLSVIIA